MCTENEAASADQRNYLRPGRAGGSDKVGLIRTLLLAQARGPRM